jgi:hypothetical protein
VTPTCGTRVARCEPGSCDASRDQSWVVVAGTLGGVILTSVGGLLWIILTTRHQRAIAELGAHREAGDRLRKERRETFVNCLAAYQDMYGKALAIANSRFQGSPEYQPSLGGGFLEQAPDEASRFSRAYHELTITGGPSTHQIARECTSKLWDLAYASTEMEATIFDRLKTSGTTITSELARSYAG